MKKNKDEPNVSYKKITIKRNTREMKFMSCNRIHTPNVMLFAPEQYQVTTCRVKIAPSNQMMNDDFRTSFLQNQLGSRHPYNQEDRYV